MLIYFQSLSILDMSYNRITRLEDAVFATLTHLSLLDLSHNNEIDVLGKTFVGLENNLIELNLNNLSLNHFPELCLSHLRTLKISHNDLSSIPFELAVNISSLRHLDLSYNNFSAIPLLIHSLPLLKSLSVAGNPIKSITNGTLVGASDTLEHLDISQLKLTNFELGALDNMSYLRTLKISSYSHINRFNIPQLIQHVSSIRSLYVSEPVQVDSDASKSIKKIIPIKTDLRLEMEGILPEKLREIQINGIGFQSIADNILKGVQSPELHFVISNTSVGFLPNSIFKNALRLRNISLDLRNSNPSLRKIPNPNMFEDVPNKLVLTHLQISGNSLNCDCELG